MKLEKCRRYFLLYVERFLTLVPELPNVTRLFLDVLYLSKVIRLCVKILTTNNSNSPSIDCVFYTLVDKCDWAGTLVVLLS